MTLIEILWIWKVIVVNFDDKFHVEQLHLRNLKRKGRSLKKYE